MNRGAGRPRRILAARRIFFRATRISRPRSLSPATSPSPATLLALTLVAVSLLRPAALAGQQPTPADPGDEPGAEVEDAGSPAATATPLSFEEAVEVALERNPAYLRELNAIAAAGHAERASLGRMLPSVGGSLSFTGTTSRVRTAFDEFGRPLEQETYVESTRSSTSQGFSGSMSLLSLQDLRSYGAARARTEAREAAAGYQAALLRRGVGRAYFEAVRRREAVAVAERSLGTAEEQLAAVRQLLRVLAREPTDVLGAELAVARAERALNQARGDARKAELELRRVMGVGMDGEYALSSAFPEPFDPAALNEAALLERALLGSPRLAEQEAGVVAAERGVSAARAARFPTLTGDYGWGRSASTRDYDAFREWNPSDRAWRFGLSLSLPLFDRFQTGSEIGRAEVEARNARESLREASLQLEQEVRASLIDLRNAWAGVRLAERSAEIARERLAQGRERYRLGTVDYTALQQMLDDVARDEQGVIDAYFSFADALLTLEEKLGGPVGARP